MFRNSEKETCIVEDWIEERMNISMTHLRQEEEVYKAKTYV